MPEDVACAFAATATGGGGETILTFLSVLSLSLFLFLAPLSPSSSLIFAHLCYGCCSYFFYYCPCPCPCPCPLVHIVVIQVKFYGIAGPGPLSFCPCLLAPILILNVCAECARQSTRRRRRPHFEPFAHPNQRTLVSLPNQPALISLPNQLALISVP